MIKKLNLKVLMIKNKLINTITKKDANYIMVSILNLNPSKFPKDKKIIKNIGDKKQIIEIENYLKKNKNYDKRKITEYISKKK